MNTNASKTIFVTGGTGNQGGAVARNLLEKGFKVKVLTRDPESFKAKALQKAGMEIIKGDLINPESFQSHLENIDGIFSVQSPEDGVKKEIKKGISLADLAARYGVQHFVYSSVAGADLKTGIPHFESKNIIENHIRKISLPFTIIRPTSLYENFLIPQVNSRLLKGKLVSPINEDVMQQLTSAEDIGKIAAGIFSNKDAFQGQTITVATEEMNLQQVANIFSKVMGKKIVYQKLPMIITRLVMGKDLHKMFKWINKNGGTFLKNIDLFKKGHPDLLSLEAWAESHFTKPLH